jgi:hypothetical protein
MDPDNDNRASLAAPHRPSSPPPPQPQYIPFVHANLHPSRLCRIPNVIDHPTVACHLPKNAIIVHFSDQSIRVAPALYQLLRSINESYVTVREEKIFADTAFYSLDQVQSSSSSSSTAARNQQHHDTESKEQPLHRDNDGSSSIRIIISDDNNNNNSNNKKPKQAAVEMADMQTENELLRHELDRQEQLLQEELAQNQEAQDLTLPLLQSTLEQLQRQNSQLLQTELDRRRRHADHLECALHSERIRLIRQVSLLYDIDTPVAPSSSASNDHHNDDNHHETTTTTIRGLSLSSNGVVSFVNHVVHILLPKYLGVFVRPPPPPTLQCLARHIGLLLPPPATSTTTTLSTTTTNTNHSPPNVLLSIREIYNHMLQYRTDDRVDNTRSIATANQHDK